jgi:predicted transcriptional regulator
MGRASASPYQAATRAGHLEHRFSLPVTAAVRTDVATMPADTTLTEFFGKHLPHNRERAVAVVDAARYLGIMGIQELQVVTQDRWTTERVGDHMRTDLPVVRPDMLVRHALTLMEQVDVDLLPVVDAGTFVGVVTSTDILRLDEILGESREP